MAQPCIQRLRNPGEWSQLQKDFGHVSAVPHAIPWVSTSPEVHLETAGTVSHSDLQVDHGSGEIWGENLVFP